jgi:hypothetical protein
MPSNMGWQARATCQALVIWYFPLRPPGDDMVNGFREMDARVFLLVNFLISHRTRTAHNQSLDTIALNSDLRRTNNIVQGKTNPRVAPD